MKYKMIVLDLDGTLTNSKKEITAVTYHALMNAQKHGTIVVLASGRPTYGIVPLAHQLQLSEYGGYILAYNGGKITNCATKTVTFNQELQPQTVPYLYEAAMSYGLNILTYKGNSILATSDSDEYVKHEAFINKMPIVQAQYFLHEIEYPVNKCLIVGNPTRLHELEVELLPKLRGTVDLYRSADYFLECVPPGIDKANSIKKLISQLHINSEEVIACGDGYNDLSMIVYAGLGVAMQNAAEEVKQKANYVTLSNEEDGVAHVINKFILQTV